MIKNYVRLILQQEHIVLRDLFLISLRNKKSIKHGISFLVQHYKTFSMSNRKKHDSVRLVKI